MKKTQQSVDSKCKPEKPPKGDECKGCIKNTNESKNCEFEKNILKKKQEEDDNSGAEDASGDEPWEMKYLKYKMKYLKLKGDL